MPLKTAAKIDRLPFSLCFRNHEGGDEETETFDEARLRSYLGQAPVLPLEAAEFIGDFESQGDTVLWVKDADGGLVYHRDFPEGMPTFAEIADLIEKYL